MNEETNRQTFIGRIIGSVRRKPSRSESREERAFRALVSKFAKIEYLMEQRALFDVVEKTPVGICITNKNYIYEYVNPAYCRIYGYDYDELIGNAFTMVVPEEHQHYLMELHDRFMNQEYELEGEWEVVRKDGKRLTILANAVYVVDDQFKPKKITFVLDRTEEKRALRKMDFLFEKIASGKALAHALADTTDENKRASYAEQLIEVFDSLTQSAEDGAADA